MNQLDYHAFGVPLIIHWSHFTTGINEFVSLDALEVHLAGDL